MKENEGKKNTHGGRRPGAGRKPKVEGCKTVTVRVPQFLKESIMAYIRLQADAIADGKGRTVDPLTPEEERTRKELMREMEALISYERKHIQMEMFNAYVQGREYKCSALEVYEVLENLQNLIADVKRRVESGRLKGIDELKDYQRNKLKNIKSIF